MTRTGTWIAALIFSAVLPLAAEDHDAWKKLQFLTGDWVGVAGEKDTPHGAGQGGFSFHPELNGKILVRRNQARYSSGVSHDDLVVSYFEGVPRAIYFDTEGHTIHYSLTFPGPESVTFDSPGYRLSYWMEKGILKGKFEVAGKTYLVWDSRRVTAASPPAKP